MILCRVVGSIVSTIKHPSYDHQKLLIVRPVAPDGTLKSGTMVAVDTVGAGEGNTVLVASEGRAAIEILGFSARQPLRSVVVGIVDHLESRQKKV
ncbi:Ethanolamine utilization protein EutN [uncultured bacterium]|nr:Ethanolamine utilization protein EutN [uncultured bacterium]